MTSFNELTSFLRNDKVVPFLGYNMAFSQSLYPLVADSCYPDEQKQYDPAGRLEPTTDQRKNLCSPEHWVPYDIYNVTLNPELVTTALKEEQEDTLIGDSIAGLAREYGLTPKVNVSPQSAHFQDFLNSYARSERRPEFFNYMPGQGNPRAVMYPPQ